MSEILKKYKSYLVVFQNGKVPVIETFYADSLDELYNMHEKWMLDNKHESGNLHVYERVDGQDEWKIINKGEIKKTQPMPIYAVVVPGAHQMTSFGSTMKSLFVHLPTGRLIKMALESENVEGFFKIHYCFACPSGKIKYCATVLTLTESEMALYLKGEKDKIEEKLSEDLGNSFGEWFIQHFEKYIEMTDRHKED